MGLCYSPVNKMQLFTATEGQMPLKHLANEHSTEKSCPHFKDIVQNFTATEHFYNDMSVNSAPILVENSYLHAPSSHGCFVRIWRYLDKN